MKAPPFDQHQIGTLTFLSTEKAYGLTSRHDTRTGQGISEKIRGVKAQHDRVLDRALERAVPGTDPREIDRITHVVIDVHKDIIAALKRLRELLS